MKNKSKKSPKKKKVLFYILIAIGAIPVILAILGIIAAVFLAAVNPSLQIEKGRCVSACAENYSKSSLEYDECMRGCAQMR